jgi:hypothetical protein
MAATHAKTSPGGGPTAAHRLERGGVLYYPTAPFPLPADDDLAFLLQRRLARWGYKNIAYNPATGKVAGYAAQSGDQVARLRALLSRFSQTVTAWLGEAFPHYHRHAELDRVSYRPEQEEGRQLRLISRNDLLHVDAFPGRPSLGRRILRVFANINPVDPRVWITSEPFAELLRKYGDAAGLPGQHRSGALGRAREWLAGMLRPCRPRRSPYDAFMLRFHDFLKRSAAFQRGCPKRQWEFPPASVWVAFTDTCSHAVLRGRYALEHSYFVAPEGLLLPRESPPALLDRAGRPAETRLAA